MAQELPSHLEFKGWIPFAVLSFLLGCASVEPEVGDPEHPPEAMSERMAETLNEIIKINAPISIEEGALSYAIRMANQADVPEESHNEWLDSMSEGFMLLAISPIGGPYAVGYALFSNTLLLPMTLSFYHHDKKIWEAITRAMKETSITGAVHESLTRRLDKLPDGALQDGLHIEVLIEGYGLDSGERDTSCLVASAQLVLSREGSDLKRTKVHISRRSRNGNPPAQCARLGDFAEDDGWLMRNSLNEYGAIIAYEAIRLAQNGGNHE